MIQLNYILFNELLWLEWLKSAYRMTANPLSVPKQNYKQYTI